MKEITQAFMKVLMSMQIQEKNIKAITQLLWNNLQGMDEVVKFIKENPNATESDVIKEAIKHADKSTSVD